MISIPPNKCEKCGNKYFKEYDSCYKCTNCGKNHGKSIGKVWAKSKMRESTSNFRPDGKTIKRVEIDRSRGVKISQTIEKTNSGEIVLQKSTESLKPRKRRNE